MAEKEDLQGLPPQVRKQKEEADKIQQELLGGKEEPKEEPEELTKEPQEEPEEEPEEPAEEPGESVEPQDTEEPEKPESTGEPEKGKTPGCSCGFEHKYNVLKGKYDKEVPRLHKETKRLRGILEDNQSIFQSLTDEIKKLKNENESLQSSGAKIADEGGAAPVSDELNPEEYEPYGDEIVKLVKAVKAQKGADTNRIKELEDEVKSLRQGTSKNEVEAYVDRLTDAVPEWEDINRDPDFIEWTNETYIPYTNITVNAMLNEANRQLDHKQVIKIFRSFLDEKKGKPEPTREPEKKRQTRLKKEDYVVPPQKPDARQPAEPTREQTYSAAQVQKAANEYARGRLSEEEFNAIVETFQAQQAQ